MISVFHEAALTSAYYRWRIGAVNGRLISSFAAETSQGQIYQRLGLARDSRGLRTCSGQHKGYYFARSSSRSVTSDYIDNSQRMVDRSRTLGNVSRLLFL